MFTGLITGCLGFVTAYAVGCVNTGYLMVARVAGRDIRALHSGSAGARNAGRILGRWGFWVVLAGDAAKGALVTVASSALIPGHPILPFLPPLVVAGHIWPVQLGYRGGKGVATFLGTLLAFPAFLTGEGTVEIGVWLGLTAALVLVIFAHRGHIVRGRLTWANPGGSRAARDAENRTAEEEVENR